jgi:potassium/hydrogen antiporter
VPVGSLATAALAHGIATTLGGSGFLAVYLVGLALGDQSLADRESLVAFHRGLAMVAEIAMFFALGLLVFPSQFGPIAVKAVLLALITVFFAVLVSAGLQGATVHSLASRVVPARPPKMRPGTHSGRAARRRSWSYKPKEEDS